MEGNIFSKLADTAGSSFNKVKSWINQMTDSDTNLETSTPIGNRSFIPDMVRGRGNTGELAGADGYSPYVEDLMMYFHDVVDNLEDDNSLQHRTCSANEKPLSSHTKPFKYQVSKLSMTCTEYSNDSGFCSHSQGRDYRPSIDDTIVSFEKVHEEYQLRSRSNTFDDTRHRSGSIPARLQKQISLAQALDGEEHQYNRKVDKLVNAFGRTVSVSSLITKIKRHPTGDEGKKHCAKAPDYSFQLQHVVIDSYEGINGPYVDGIQNDAEQDFDLKTNFLKSTQSGAFTGRLKIALQYFETSKVLRVIVLRATDLKATKGQVFPRLVVHLGNSKKKHKKISLRKVKAQQDVVFNEDAFFEDIDEEEIDELTLRVSIFNKEGTFRFTKCIGEMVVPIYKYDVSMDTNIWGNLRQKRSRAEVKLLCLSVCLSACQSV